MTPATSMFDQVRELLERYKAASDKISVEYIDPEREPLKTTQLAEKFGVQVADTVVFVLGDRTKYVTSDQMAEMDYSGMQYGQGPDHARLQGRGAVHLGHPFAGGAGRAEGLLCHRPRRGLARGRGRPSRPQPVGARRHPETGQHGGRGRLPAFR